MRGKGALGRPAAETVKIAALVWWTGFPIVRLIVSLLKKQPAISQVTKGGLLSHGSKSKMKNQGTFSLGIINPGAISLVVTNPETINLVVTNPGAINLVVTNPGAINLVVTNPEAINPGVPNLGLTNPGMISQDKKTARREDYRLTVNTRLLKIVRQ